MLELTLGFILSSAFAAVLTFGGCVGQWTDTVHSLSIAFAVLAVLSVVLVICRWLASWAAVLRERMTEQGLVRAKLGQRHWH